MTEAGHQSADRMTPFIDGGERLAACPLRVVTARLTESAQRHDRAARPVERSRTTTLRPNPRRRPASGS
jgi:hypothetical protein